MGISKRLQRLRGHILRSRLFQLLFTTSIVAIIIGIFFISKKPFLKTEGFKCCLNGQVVLLSGPTSSPFKIDIPIRSYSSLEEIIFLELEGRKWKVVALRTNSIGDLMADLSVTGAKECPFPFIAVVQDLFNREYLLIFEQDKQISLSSIQHCAENSMKRIEGKYWIEILAAKDQQENKNSPSICIQMF